MKRLSIVIPCYNNAENIPALQACLLTLQQDLESYELEVILVDDGSEDDTYSRLTAMTQAVPFRTILVKLTSNFGSYNAFLAGLHQGTGDVYAQVHADLQDPPEHLKTMLPYWENGIPFVIGQRVKRDDKESNLFFANLYHRLMKRYALPHIPEGGYDLILFDKALRDHIVQMNEGHTNLVYLISWLKYPYVTVPITRVARRGGRSQWTLAKKYKLVIDSMVSFSYAPIRLITLCFLAVAILSVPLLAYLLIFSDTDLFTRIFRSFLILAADLGMFSLSIISEYVWRTLEFSRNRPPFVVEKVQVNEATPADKTGDA